MCLNASNPHSALWIIKELLNNLQIKNLHVCVFSFFFNANMKCYPIYSTLWGRNVMDLTASMKDVAMILNTQLTFLKLTYFTFN